MMPKGNEKRETQQNPLLLPPARSKKGNEKQRKPRNPLPLKQVWLPKGNEKRETQQNPLPLPPARSEKGNENRGNPRNPLPFSACEAGKGNEKRETQQNPLPLPPARSEKGNEKQRNPRNPLPHSCFPQKGKKRKRQQPQKGSKQKAPKQQGSRTKVRLPYSIFSQQLLLTIFFQNLLNSLGWIQQVCDGGIVVQSVDEKSDVLAHVNIDVVFFGKKFFRLVDKVCCHYAVDETTFKGFVKFLQSVCEKTKCGSDKDTVCFAALQFGSDIDHTLSGRCFGA